MNPFLDFFQQNAALFTVLAAVATVLGVAFTFYKTAHGRQVTDLREQLGQKDRRIETLEREGPEGQRLLNEQLQKQLNEAQADQERLRADYAAAEDAWRTQLLTLQQQDDRHRGTVESLTKTLEEAREELAGRDRLERSRVNLLKRAMRLQGKVWERRVLQGAPRFRALSERHAPIISVLNLKGGVGKTTITAHLGAALSAKGYNVLLMDLDLQGSLSSLFMNESALVQRSEEGRLLQHFLLNAAERRKVNLLDYCVPIFDGKSAIVPNADSMAYAELNLTMQWLLRIGKRDTRFLLRKALHQRRVTRRFDVVLLDCPPLFNTCCVNALAVSDYILIPVVPSRKAAERVPLLLERVQSLHRVINPQLQVMGVLLNRTHASSLTAWELDLWREMLEHGKDRWRLPVHAFETFIRQTTEVRDGETEFSPPARGVSCIPCSPDSWLKWKRGYPVTVAELQSLLSDLGKFLRASESAKVAGELEYICTKLAPFRSYKLKAFADFLEQAEAYSRGALAPKTKGGGAKKAKADPAAIEQACQRILDLYGKAIDPSVTVDQIEAGVQALQDLDAPKTRLDELARQMGYSQKFRGKADVIKAIRHKVIGRKGAFERPNA